MQMQFLALGYIFVYRRGNIGKQAIYVTLILCHNVISYMLFLTCYFLRVIILLPKAFWVGSWGV